MKSARFIKKVLRESGLSQKELAVKLDTTQATISRLINGQYKISPSLRLRIVSRFGYGYNYIFEEVD